MSPLFITICIIIVAIVVIVLACMNRDLAQKNYHLTEQVGWLKSCAKLYEPAELIKHLEAECAKAEELRDAGQAAGDPTYYRGYLAALRNTIVSIRGYL